MKDRKTLITIAVIITITSLFIVFGEMERKKARLALQNNEQVDGMITWIEPGKDQAMITVRFKYKDTVRLCEFVTSIDTFAVGEKVVIKVAKQYPQKYISFVRKIK